MGSTPRQHRYQIPLATRSTDISTIAQCPGSWALKLFYEKEQAEASYFHLGSQLHETIEVAINMALDLDWALRHLNAGIDRRLEVLTAASHVLESSQRGVDSMRDDAERMLRQWFKTVHPDSDKRLPIYDEYEWPPSTEVPISRSPEYSKTVYSQWGSVDAVFLHRTEEGVALIDWKSGTSRQKSSDQLHYYMYVGSHLGGGILSNRTGWFHHLDKVQPRSIIQMADPYPGDDVVRQRILATEAVKDSLVKGKYPKFIPSALCNWCSVQQFCPADGDYRNREENARNLRSMLKLARGMETIEREVA